MNNNDRISEEVLTIESVMTAQDRKNIKEIKDDMEIAANVAISAAILAGITIIYFTAPYIKDPMSSPYGINALNVLKNCHSIKDVLQQAPCYGVAIPEAVMIGLPIAVRVRLSEKLRQMKETLTSNKSNKDKGDLEPDI